MARGDGPDRFFRDEVDKQASPDGSPNRGERPMCDHKT